MIHGTAGGSSDSNPWITQTYTNLNTFQEVRTAAEKNPVRLYPSIITPKSYNWFHQLCCSRTLSSFKQFSFNSSTDYTIPLWYLISDYVLIVHSTVYCHINSVTVFNFSNVYCINYVKTLIFFIHPGFDPLTFDLEKVPSLDTPSQCPFYYWYCSVSYHRICSSKI